MMRAGRTWRRSHCCMIACVAANSACASRQRPPGADEARVGERRGRIVHGTPWASSSSRGRYRRPSSASSATSRRILVSCSARPRWPATECRSRPARRRSARTAARRRRPPGRNRDRGWRASAPRWGRHIHLHALDDRHEVAALEPEGLGRPDQRAGDHLPGIAVEHAHRLRRATRPAAPSCAPPAGRCRRCRRPPGRRHRRRTSPRGAAAPAAAWPSRTRCWRPGPGGRCRRAQRRWPSALSVKPWPSARGPSPPGRAP
jgi:hypothetical protein